jgi:glycerophosphoryl diester phosphodiesterase
MFSPLVIAHRGSSFDAPENTITAFNRAITESADGIELDVRLTRDGVPVCIHDAMLNRTALRSGRINQTLSADLAEMDAGTWFNRRFPRRADETYSSTRIPTLAEVLHCCRAAKRKFSIYIEMKCGRGEEETLAGAVSDVVSSDGGNQRVIVASFNLETIQAIKSCDSSLRTAAIFEPTMTNPRPAILELIRRATDAGASEMMLHRHLVARRAANIVAEHGFPLTVWTVDDRGWARRALDYNLHAVITNRPGKMRASLAELATVS